MAKSNYQDKTCCWRTKQNSWGQYQCNKCGASLCYVHITLWNNKEPRCYYCFSEVECKRAPENIIILNNSTLSNPKVVLVVLDGLYLAGMQRHVLDQLDFLRDYGYGAIIITVDGAGGRWANKFLLKAEKIILDVDSRLSWGTFIEIIGNKKIDFAIGHLSNPIRWINNNLPSNVRAFAHFHTDPSEFEIIRDSEFVRYCERFEKILFPSFVTLNHYASMFLNGNAEKYKGKLKVLPNPLPQNMKGAHLKSRIPSQMLKIAVVSRLDNDKISTSLLVETLLLIKRAREDFIVLIAGGGELFREIYQKIQDCDLDGNVKLLGFVDSVEKIYQWADLVFLPSIREAMPYVLLESITFGKPIVAPRVGIFKDISLPGNAYTFEVGDSATAAKLILDTPTSSPSIDITENSLISNILNFKSWSEMSALIYELQDDNKHVS